MTSCVYESNMWLWLQIEHCKQYSSCFSFSEMQLLLFWWWGQATCSTKSTSSTSCARASSLHPHPSAFPFQQQPWPYSGQNLWQNSWAGQQQIHERNEHLPAHSPNNAFWSLHLLWLGCSFWKKALAHFKYPKLALFSSRTRCFHFENCRPFLTFWLAVLFTLASGSFWPAEGNTASETLLPTETMLAWLRKAKSISELDISSHGKFFAFSGKALLPSLPSAGKAATTSWRAGLVSSTAGSRPFL